MSMVSVTLTSLQPLLMHSPQGVNPLVPLVKEKKSLTSKRKKTDEDLQRVMEIDYELGLYYDDTLNRPVIPSNCVEGMIRNSARKIRRGVDVISSITVTPNNIPLEYEGVKKKEELLSLFRSGVMKFADVRSGVINNARVQLCRPRFDKWSITCEIDYDETVFNQDEIIALLITGGQKIGLCDYRPKYGTFAVKVNK